MFVVVRTADEETLDLLRTVWGTTGIGAVNVVGLDEIQALPRSGQEMVTTNAKVLWGTNPFTEPTPEDFAADLCAVADSLARDSRILLLYAGLTDAERAGTAKQITGKWGLGWAARCLVAFRSGSFPETAAATLRALEDLPEGPALRPLLDLAPTDRHEQIALAKTVNGLARGWLREIGSAR